MDTSTTTVASVVQLCALVPSDLHRTLKIAAATDGITLATIVTEAVSEWLDRRGEA
jgi:predicted HicB family RNase H-like nuclease